MEEQKYNIIGKRLVKVEAVEKATGQLKYSGDLIFPNTLHARILRSPHAHAYIKNIDISRASKVKGVKAIITHKDVPEIPTMHQFLHLPAVMYYDSFLLEEKVRHYGDRVAAVAAASPDIAEEALELIEVEYEPLPVVLDPLEATKPGAPVIHEEARRGTERIKIKNNVVGTREIEIGDVAQGFRDADIVVENVYRTSRPNCAPMERTAITCVPGPGGKLDIYGTTQGIHTMRMNIASSLGIPLQKVNCHHVFLGGSFGAHIHTGWIEPICAFLALLTGQPVRGEKTREEMFLSCGRHPMVIALKTGATKDGRIIAQEMDVVDETGAYALSGQSKMVLAAGWSLSMYNCPNMRFTGRTVYTNTPPLTAMRGAGNPQVHFAVESQMDIISEKLDMDPVELRLRNHISTGDTFCGQGPDVICEVQSCGTEELLHKAAKKIEWGSRTDHSTDRSWRKRGIGMARGYHTSGSGSAKPSKFIMDYTGAIVKMNEDGTAVLLIATADAGGGNTTAHAAMVAETLEIAYHDVTVEGGDTNTTLFDVPTHSSRSNYGAGRAVVAAAEKVKKILLEWASEILEARLEDLDARNGEVFVTGVQGKTVSIKEIVQTAQVNGWGSAFGHATVRPDACPPHFIVSFVEVIVDTQTGGVEVVRAISGADVGTPINVNSVEGQITGGLHMGLGYGLLEDTCFEGGTGKILTPDFRDYKMLTFIDMPEMETIISDTFEPTGPFGAKGVGEGATNPVAAAIANAIYNAVGVRIKDLPISAEKILSALRENK